MKIKDFKCNYSDYTGIQKDFINTIDLALPDMYLNGEDMAAYAIAIRKKEGRSYCKLPFDTAVEGEALGAVLKYDDSPLGPRKDGDLINNIPDILQLPAIDPKRGRMHEILKACDLLRGKGEIVTLEIRGLFDTLNSITDIQKVMMTWVMDADLMKQICDKIRADIIAWFTEAKNHCDLLLYSDSSGGVNVIGPRMAKQLVEWFTYPLMTELNKILQDGPLLFMCPKTAFMLVGADKAEFCKIETGVIKYIDFSIKPPNNSIRFLGNKCTKKLDDTAIGHVHYLNLK